MLLFYILAALAINITSGCYAGEEFFKCFDTVSWATYTTREIAYNAAKAFCSESAQNNWATEPKFEKTPLIVKGYHDNTPDYMALSMAFDLGQRPTEEWCLRGFSYIIDNCDKNVKENPVEWFHGGRINNITFTDGTTGPSLTADYTIYPQRRRYTPGCCNIWVSQRQHKIKKDKYEHFVSGSVLDADNVKIFDFNEMRSDHGIPAQVGGLQALLEMTAEQRGDYIHFKLGGQEWWSNGKIPHSRACSAELQSCAVTKYKELEKNQVTRGVHCWFDC